MIVVEMNKSIPPKPRRGEMIVVEMNKSIPPKPRRGEMIIEFHNFNQKKLFLEIIKNSLNKIQLSWQAHFHKFIFNMFLQ